MDKGLETWADRLRAHGLKPRVLTPEERKAKEKEESIKYTAMHEKQLRRQYMDNSKFPDSIDKHFSFKDWQPNKQEDVNKAKQVARKALDLSNELKQDDFNVLLFGNAGSGKTSLAIAMLNRLTETKTTMFISIIEWLAMKYQSFSDERVSNQVYVLEQMMKKLMYLF